MSYLVFDIGGTKTHVALSEDLKTLREIKSFATPKSFKAGIDAIVSVAAHMKPEGEWQAVAGGVRGLLNESRTGIENDGILGGWAGKSIVEALQEHFTAPIYLENDTAMAGLGEAHFGAGKDVDIMVFHTISTGVGGVKIENGEIDSASAGFEPGHQVLDIDRTILGDEITPTLENLVSGAGLEARLGLKPTEIPQEDMVWNELAGYLAQGLRNTILYWSPEMIVLGGSMMLGDPKIPLEAVRKSTVDVLDSFVPCPYITVAELGDEAALYGALAFLANKP